MNARAAAWVMAIIIFISPLAVSAEESEKRADIKWVDFNVPAPAMARAMKLDIESYGKQPHLDWISILAILATRCGGNWSSYKAGDMDSVVQKLQSGQTPADILQGYKNYEYYYTAYSAVLGGYLGEHQREIPDKDNPGKSVLVERYGLKAYSPIAEGYSYSHFKDFGVSRSYGYRRQHFGNDLTGSVGTPIIALEGGTIEELGWNQYGGWRVGVRSFDKLRYYYYAHLRKDHPWPAHLEKGMRVQGGDVIGYLGMTGYSATENVNGMNVPHLHFGLQLVFDEAQKDASTQLWIDVYEIVELLSHNRATVLRDPETKEYSRKYHLYDYNLPHSD